jgi:hypothetical protein
MSKSGAKNLDRLSAIGVEGFVAADLEGVSQEFRGVPKRQLGQSAALGYVADRSLTEKVLEEWRSLRPEFKNWGSYRYFDLVWSHKSTSPYVNPLDVKLVVKVKR